MSQENVELVRAGLKRSTRGGSRPQGRGPGFEVEVARSVPRMRVRPRSEEGVWAGFADSWEPGMGWREEIEEIRDLGNRGARVLHAASSE